jgi:O-antigen/teichoic acid export membrane protein
LAVIPPNGTSWASRSLGRLAANERVWLLGRRATGAVTTTFINAGGSLVLQILAARTLGAAGYGAFAIISSILVLMTSVQTAWVGDSLTVLDRLDHGVRRALIVSQAGFVALSILVCLGGTILLGIGGVRLGLLFGVAVSLWICEELGRRILMARLEFWALVLNDSIYVVASLIALVGLRAAAGSYSLEVFVLAIAIGAAVAIVALFFQLPEAETEAPSAGSVDLGEVARFAGWRSGQAAIRPMALLLMRVLVAAIASKAVLGQIEAARLLIAPALTFISGAGTFLLPMYSDDHRKRGGRTLPLGATMAALFGSVCLYGLVVLGFLHPLTTLLTGGTYRVAPVAVVGWALFAGGFGAGLAPAALAVARRQSREVFYVRVLDSAIGLAAAAVLLAFHRANLAPLALAIGMYVGATLLVRVARREVVAAP